MKLSTLNSKLQLISVGQNSKTIKGDSDSKLTAIMYLASSTMSGYDVCEYASDQCRKVCLITAGRGQMTSVQKARIRKTQLFFEDNKSFINTLINDLILFSNYCLENKIQPYVRLNGTSDLDFSRILIKSKTLFEIFPNINFYDYTKDPNRSSAYSNYKLTFSRSENTDLNFIKNKINSKINVAVVFEEVPSFWEGIKVIDGDLTDLRFEDEVGVIVGLKPKGLAKKTKEDGFVIRKLPSINI